MPTRSAAYSARQKSVEANLAVERSNALTGLPVSQLAAAIGFLADTTFRPGDRVVVLTPRLALLGGGLVAVDTDEVPGEVLAVKPGLIPTAVVRLLGGCGAGGTWEYLVARLRRVT